MNTGSEVCELLLTQYFWPVTTTKNGFNLRWDYVIFFNIKINPLGKVVISTNPSFNLSDFLLGGIFDINNFLFSNSSV